MKNRNIFSVSWGILPLESLSLLKFCNWSNFVTCSKHNFLLFVIDQSISVTC